MKVQFYDTKEVLPPRTGAYWAVAVEDGEAYWQAKLHYNAELQKWNCDGADPENEMNDIRFWAVLPTYEELRNDW